MKHIYTLLLGIFLCSSAWAQTSVYHPFPDSNAVWNVFAQGCCANNCATPPFPNPVMQDFVMSYFLAGDTLINNMTYQKLLKSGSAHEHCYFGTGVNNWNFFNNDYTGGIRQDTSLRRVYFIYDNNSTECLLYDFNLVVGDTAGGNCIFPNDCGVITSIDSVFIGGSYRNRFNFAGLMPYSLIEGIGSTSGLLEPLCPFEYFGVLNCMTHNGQVLYTDSVSICNNFTNTETINDQLEIHVVPNPFTTSVTVHLGSKISSGKWIMYDLVGNKVKEGLVDNQEISIERGSLNAGMYFLQITSNNSIKAVSKLLIE